MRGGCQSPSRTANSPPRTRKRPPPAAIAAGDAALYCSYCSGSVTSVSTMTYAGMARLYARDLERARPHDARFHAPVSCPWSAVLDPTALPEGLQRLLHGQQFRGRELRECATGHGLYADASDRHVIRQLEKPISVVVPECVPEPVQLAPCSLDYGPDRLATVLRVCQEP